jgi:general secretion pathway protein H
LTRSTSLRASAGFTLLELLVVVVLIGIMASLITVSVSMGDLEDRMVEEAKRMQALMSLAREEAILQNRELAMSVTDNSYEFEVLDEGKWKPIRDDKVFRQREIHSGLRLSLLVDDVQVQLTKDKKDTPPSKIYFLSSGEITPFELILRSDDKAFERRLKLNDEGEIEVVKPEEVF